MSNCNVPIPLVGSTQPPEEVVDVIRQSGHQFAEHRPDDAAFDEGETTGIGP